MCGQAGQDHIGAVNGIVKLQRCCLKGSEPARIPELENMAPTREMAREGGELLRAGVSVTTVAKRLGVSRGAAYNRRDMMIAESSNDLDDHSTIDST